jgi:hypothetical protein
VLLLQRGLNLLFRYTRVALLFQHDVGQTLSACGKRAEVVKLKHTSRDSEPRNPLYLALCEAERCFRRDTLVRVPTWQWSSLHVRRQRGKWVQTFSWSAASHSVFFCLAREKNNKNVRCFNYTTLRIMNMADCVWSGEDAVVSKVAGCSCGQLSSLQSRLESVMIHHMVTNGMRYTRAL